MNPANLATDASPVQHPSDSPPHAVREVAAEYNVAIGELLDAEHELFRAKSRRSYLQKLLVAVRTGDALTQIKALLPTVDAVECDRLFRVADAQLEAMRITRSRTLDQCERELGRLICRADAEAREMEVHRDQAVQRKHAMMSTWEVVTGKCRAPVVQLPRLLRAFRCIRARPRSSRRARTVARVARKSATGDPDGDGDPPGDRAERRAIADDLAVALIGGVS